MSGGKAWRGEPQPIDTIQSGDPIPPEICRGGKVVGALALRYLVPTLSEARARELGELLDDILADLIGSVSTSELRAFVSKHAPERV